MKFKNLILGAMLILSATMVQPSFAAGEAKPNVENLGPEVKATLLYHNATSGSSGQGLFDGTTVDEWSTPKVCYWGNSGVIIEMEIPKKVNIWRSGTTNWHYHNEDLVISKLINGTYVDVTADYVQRSTSITNNQWEKAIENLPEGRYQFTIKATDGLRIDSEWYLEDASFLPKDEEFVLKSVKSDYNVGEIINVDLIALNGKNLCAIDTKLEYDPEKLELISNAMTDGMIEYSEVTDPISGKLRYILAINGKDNVINGEKVLTTLKFKAKTLGAAKIDILKTRIADNGTYEKNVSELKNGEIILNISKRTDVNRDGFFTLLDLGIDSWYKGFKAADTDTSKYDADVIVNGNIDEVDLQEIVKQILTNTDYEISFNN